MLTRKKSKTVSRRFSSDTSTVHRSSVSDELRHAGDYEIISSSSQKDKKNYAESFSRALAQRFSDALRGSFAGILPTQDGSGQELRARTGKGLKKLDVNYSTVELGLGLGVSIKTINFRDPKTKRYTKNYTRVDNELRAEAADYHERQPYSVLCAIIFLPVDACEDGSERTPSSFGQSIQIFRHRAGRDKPSDDPTLFERILVGLYSVAHEDFGNVCFFDVMNAPPKKGRPEKMLTFQESIDEIVSAYDRRNGAKFEWADGAVEILTNTEANLDDDDEP